MGFDEENLMGWRVCWWDIFEKLTEFYVFIFLVLKLFLLYKLEIIYIFTLIFSTFNIFIKLLYLVALCFYHDVSIFGYLWVFYDILVFWNENFLIFQTFLKIEILNSVLKNLRYIFEIYLTKFSNFHIPSIFLKLSFIERFLLIDDFNKLELHAKWTLN